MNDINISSFNIIGQDNRGLTSLLTLPRAQQDFVFLTRVRGSISGNTYHKGKMPGTNPKVFLLLSGKILFSYRNVQKEGPAIKQEVLAPAKIEVSPFVTHQVEVIEEAIFLECNSISDIQADRHNAFVETMRVE